MIPALKKRIKRETYLKEINLFKKSREPYKKVNKRSLVNNKRFKNHIY